MSTTRRDFLIDGLRVGAALPLLDPLSALGPLGTGSRAGESDERVLVVLQLSGGNDGLNTVVPHRQDAYYRLRPTLALARDALHRLDDDHGLHPEMSGLGELFAEGKLACVHGVGYPSPSRSHFRSMEIWHTADPDHPAGDVGWLGRLADRASLENPAQLVAMHVGDGSLPRALWGEHWFAPTVRDPEGLRLRGVDEGFAALRDGLLADDGTGGDVAFLRQAARMTYRSAERMEALSRATTPVEYPDSALARRLRLVARLIAGGFGTRVFQVELDGFDTHARQAPVHADLLGRLSAALLAFQHDLEACGAEGRVVTLVFSEFGRRAAENGSRGTDHGAAAPVLLLGSPVRGGLHGSPPDLEGLVEGDVPHATDFRAIYAELEERWMGSPPSGGVGPLTLLS